MANASTPDRRTMFVWSILAILGAILLIVGWYRWAN